MHSALVVMLKTYRATVRSHISYATMIALTKIGRFVPERTVTFLNCWLSLLATGRFFYQHAMAIPKRVKTREQVYDAIAAAVANDPVLYLEFGVWRGESLRWWSNALHNPDAALHAFDSFEGLPEDWDPRFPKGSFSAGGKLPDIQDPRVKLFVGWFSETLPAYHPPRCPTLIINIDCDVYRSAKTVLDNLKPYICVGSYLYFDEFWDRFSEQRAFSEYLAETGQRWRVVAATRPLMEVAFRRVA